MKVLVTFAVPAEFAPWRARHDFRRVNFGVVTGYETRIGEAEVTVLLTGVGLRAVSERDLDRVMKKLAANGQFDFCISSGLAGALHPEYRAGEVLAAKWVQTEKPRPWRNGRIESLGAHRKLLGIAEGCGARVVDKFLTSTRIVQSREEKTRLAVNADAVEMESFSILLNADAFCALGVAIRAVSDSAHEDLPLNFNAAVTEDGGISVLRLLRQLGKRPKHLPGLIRFAVQTKRSATALADFLDCYIPAVSAGLPKVRPAEEAFAL